GYIESQRQKIWNPLNKVQAGNSHSSNLLNETQKDLSNSLAEIHTLGDIQIETLKQSKDIIKTESSNVLSWTEAKAQKITNFSLEMASKLDKGLDDPQSKLKSNVNQIEGMLNKQQVQE